jgi:hypothetical protein
MRILLGLDAFFTGGLLALLAVNHLLQEHMNRYAVYDMEAASTVLDLMDNLLAYLVPCSGLLLFLVLVTVAIGVWTKVKPRGVRYGATALVLAVILLYAASIGVLIIQTSAAPSVLPTTPTPASAEGAVWKPRAPEALDRVPNTLVPTRHPDL